MLPPALALRKEDAELEARLDALGGADEVRTYVTDFNERVRRTLYGNPGGPPVVTAPRDVEAEVVAWRERREARRTSAASSTAAPRPGEEHLPRRRWFFRRRSS